MKEMQKAIAGYKEELEHVRKVESTFKQFEDYQKLIIDFNDLHDHYKVSKLAQERLRTEL